jgi:hypothetical protein
VHLSSLVLLREQFCEDNVHELLEQASGRTKREIEHLVARLAPKPDVVSKIRKQRGSIATKPQLQPLSEARYRVQLTASASLRDKLEHARRLSSHRNPGGDLAEIVEQALDLLIDKLEKAKLGKTDRPRASAIAPKNPARVTRSARREVVERDGLQCAFIGTNGERCPSRELLEFDHRTPRACGGTGDATNVRLLCRAHNVFAAEQIFGRAHIEERIDDRREQLATKDRVRSALRSMGFRSAEAERAVATLNPTNWNARPIELLMRDAIGVIT